ncbi:FAD-linked oxidase, partial [Rhizobium phaseoli]
MPPATVRGAGRREEIMDNLNLTTLQSGQTMVNDVAMDAFAAGFRGNLLTSKDTDY